MSARKNIRRRATQNRAHWLVAGAVLLACGGAAAGDITYWQVGTGTWFDDLNWTMGIPQVGDIAHINNAGTAQIASGSGEQLYLYLGDDGGESGGTVELSGTGSLSANYDAVGLSGTGTFTQTGGTNTASFVYVGYGLTGQGTYALSGTGQLSALLEYGGWDGTGTFTQTGGTNTVNWVILGYHETGRGTYELSGTGQLSADGERVGRYGTGTFTQTGGMNMVTGDLYLGSEATAQGTYELSGTGQLLSADEEYVGQSGTGTFTQTGGTNTVTNDLFLGYGATGDGTYTISAGTLAVGGLIEVGGLGTGAFNLNGGLVIADEVAKGASGTFNFTGGTLRVGSFQGDLTNAGGTLAPDSSAGTTVVTGDYTQQAGGVLEIEVAGPAPGQWDVLAVTGVANLDGELQVVLDGHTPAVGDAFTVLTYGSRSGEFDSITGWDHDELAHLAFYGANDLTLHCTWFGDANLDGGVDGADYTLWADHYGMAGLAWADGDFNGDTVADGADYTLWADNFTGGGSSVPEPATLAVLGLGVLAVFRRRFASLYSSLAGQRLSGRPRPKGDGNESLDCRKPSPAGGG